MVQAVQASHIVEKWVDNAHSKLKDKEARWISVVNTLAMAKKKRKYLTLKLIEVERERKSVEATLAGAEQLAITCKKIKPQ